MTMDASPNADHIFTEHRQAAMRGTDRMFLWLLLAQWVFAVVLALATSPYTWSGATRSLHPHVSIALWLGFAINVLPIALIMLRPGSAATRHTIAAAQMLWSALLIHITGGRIETHFHIFGSLAFLAFYRDWRVLITATLVTAADHFLRGLWFPESVYGIAQVQYFRFIEHTFWVAFEDLVLILGCRRGLAELRAIAQREASLQQLNASIERLVALKTEELQQNMARYKALVEGTSAVPWEIDVKTMLFTYISPQVLNVFGLSDKSLINNPDAWRVVHPEDRIRFRAELVRLATELGETTFEYRLYNARCEVVHVRTTATAHRDPDGVLRHIHGITLNVTEHKQLEHDLHQAQKLESVGRLAAGVAHEINTPIQFVSDNVRFLRDATVEMFTVLERLRRVNDDVLAGRVSQANAEDAAAADKAADFEFLNANVPAALESSIDGLQRVAEIVRSMKEFAHPDHDTRQRVDLNHSIQNTLTITKNEYRYVAELVTDFGELPPIWCNMGGINQVLVNIVVNAAHAIADVVGDSGALGRITVATRCEGDHAVIAVTDTGGGIPVEARDRVFEPFFTTKEVGKGTGQGLAIARTIVVDRHGGQLRFETTAGVGTTFFIMLPIGSAESAARAAA
jgi:two-component system, NtrC family, sensor kinase